MKREEQNMGEEKKRAARGCIKTSRGPWIFHRSTKNGGTVTKYRFPTDKEREKNKQREQRRRALARNIFAGLKQHGNYKLPKHPHTNDLLMALCEEAGWFVQQDGTIHKKHQEDQDCNQSNDQHISSECGAFPSSFSTEEFCNGDERYELNLSLSLSPSSPF